MSMKKHGASECKIEYRLSRKGLDDISVLNKLNLSKSS